MVLDAIPVWCQQANVLCFALLVEHLELAWVQYLAIKKSKYNKNLKLCPGQSRTNFNAGLGGLQLLLTFTFCD